MQPKNGAKCCKNTAVISRRVRLELMTFDYNGIGMCVILNKYVVAKIIRQRFRIAVTVSRCQICTIRDCSIYIDFLLIVSYNGNKFLKEYDGNEKRRYGTQTVP